MIPNRSISPISDLSISNTIEIEKNTGGLVGTEGRVNFIEGSAITLTVTDVPASNRVDVTIASTGAVTAHNVLSTTHSDTLAASVVRGDLIVGNSTPKWSRLAIGTSGKVLRSDGTDASWTTLTVTDAGITPAALTKVDDTNVTATLGGTPTTALLQATSITLGWTGTLSDSRLSTTAVTPGTYGSATQVGVFTVGGTGRITSASNTTIALSSSAITPPGSNTQVIFNDGGAFGAVSKLTYNKTTYTLSNVGVAGTQATFVLGSATASAAVICTDSIIQGVSIQGGDANRDNGGFMFAAGNDETGSTCGGGGVMMFASKTATNSPRVVLASITIPGLLHTEVFAYDVSTGKVNIDLLDQISSATGTILLISSDLASNWDSDSDNGYGWTWTDDFTSDVLRVFPHTGGLDFQYNSSSKLRVDSTGVSLPTLTHCTLNLDANGLLSEISHVALGSVLISQGTTTKPVWSTDLATGVTIGGAYSYRVGGTDVAVADGGTGLSVYAVGDLVHASATTTLAGLADTAVGRVLISGGVGVAPSYSATPTVTGIITTYVAPSADSTTAIRFMKADTTTVVVTIDTTNANIGIGKTPAGILDISRSTNGVETIALANASTGGSSTARLRLRSGTASDVIIDSSHVNAGGFFYDNAGKFTVGTSGAFQVALMTANVNRLAISAVGASVFTQAVSTSAASTVLTVTGAAHTTLANAEQIDNNFNNARTVQFTGSATLALQRSHLIQAPTYSSDTATKAITLAFTTEINGAPAAGTNVTLTSKAGARIIGGLVLGSAALATSATTGFLYIPSCAGTPSGTPEAHTGTVATIYDTTNNKLYVYNGAWKSVTLA